MDKKTLRIAGGLIGFAALTFGAAAPAMAAPPAPTRVALEPNPSPLVKPKQVSVKPVRVSYPDPEWRSIHPLPSPYPDPDWISIHPLPSP